MKYLALSVMVTALLAPRGLAAEKAAEGGGDDTLALLVDVLKTTDDPAAQADMLRGLVAAMEGKRNVKMPAGWPELAARFAKSPNEEVRKTSQALSAVFGDAGTLDAMKKTVADAAQPVEQRRKALESLLQKGDPALAGLLQSLLKDKDLREQAVKGLATIDDPKTPAAILGGYPTFDASTRLAAVNALAVRTAWAKDLMAAVKEKKVPAGDLTAYTIRQLRTLGDKEVDAWVTATWGVARTTPDEKIKLIDKYKAMLTADDLAKADLPAGRALFAKTCQQCHLLYGEGGKVGPDLTGSNRADADYLLVNIIDPSAVIAKDYQVTNVWTKDAEVLSGILTRDDAQAITIVTETTSTTVPRDEIETMKKSELSMMPEGLLVPLSKQDVVNLVSYLRHPSQVPLPPGAQVPAPASAEKK